MAKFTVKNSVLERYNQSWDTDSCLNQGYYVGGSASNPSLRHWVSYAPISGYNIDHTKNMITKIKISFTANGGSYSSSKQIGVYFGLTKDNAKALRSGTNKYTDRKYVYTIAKHSSSGDTRSVEITDATVLLMFETYFPLSKSLVFYSEADRGYSSSTYNHYSSNYVSMKDLVLEVEYKPKGATFSNPPTSINIGSASSITISSLSGSGYTYEAIWSLGKQTLSSGQVSSSTISKTIPSSWGSELNSSWEGTGAITLITYLNGSETGRNAITVKFIVPTYTISNTGFSATVGTNYYNSSGNAVYLVNLSTITINFNDALKYYGATLTTKTITYNGKTENITGTTKTITLGTVGTITAAVTDSRGKTSTKNFTYTITSSNLPTLSNLTIARCDDSGNYATSGKNVRFVGTISSGDTLALKYGTALNSYPTSKSLTATTDGWRTTGDTFSDEKSYYFKLTVSSSRYFKSSNKTNPVTKDYYLQIGSSKYLIHFRKEGNGLGLGCAAETADAVTIGWNLNLKGDLGLTTALGVTSGGTGAKKQKDAWTNIVAPGGKITGGFAISNSPIWNTIGFDPTLNNQTLGQICYQTGTTGTTNQYNQSRFYFRQNSYVTGATESSDNYLPNGKYEYYRLPNTEANLETSITYDILTTKTVIYWDGSGTQPAVINGGIMLKKI